MIQKFDEYKAGYGKTIITATQELMAGLLELWLTREMLSKQKPVKCRLAE